MVQDHAATRFQLVVVHERHDVHVVLHAVVHRHDRVVVVDHLLHRAHLQRRAAQLLDLFHLELVLVALGLERFLVLHEFLLEQQKVLDPLELHLA